MRSVAYLACGLAIAAGTVPAVAACPGNRDAIGTSRVLAISTTEFARIGSMQYGRTLPLGPREVVLTFDDGPLPPYTSRVLDALAAECVKATFFLVGRQASASPDMVRRIYNAGHTIGTHSQNHPLTFDRMSLARAQREIGDGIASVAAAAGDTRAVAPFFRIPGLLRSHDVENELASRSLAVWSADVVADDWYRTTNAKAIVRKAMTRLNAKGRGILLLHDIHPATAQAVPALLRELKAGGYRIVHVVPGGERPRSVPELVASSSDKQGWPRVAQVSKRGKYAAQKPARQRGKAVRRYYVPNFSAGIQRQRARTASQGWTFTQR